MKLNAEPFWSPVGFIARTSEPTLCSTGAKLTKLLTSVATGFVRGQKTHSDNHCEDPLTHEPYYGQSQPKL